MYCPQSRQRWIRSSRAFVPSQNGCETGEGLGSGRPGAAFLASDGLVIAYVPSTSDACSLMSPPLPLTKASPACLTCRAPARPCSWRTASVTCDMPPASPRGPQGGGAPGGFGGEV